MSECRHTPFVYPKSESTTLAATVGRTFARLAIVMLALFFAGTAPALASYQGFGSGTSGGSGKTVVHVTNLNDSGSGSLRSAVSQGDRYVVFDVAGTINLQSVLTIGGANLTIDGSSAPSPGITLKQAGILLSGSSVHDVILTGIRIRNPGVNYSEGDAITIKNGVYNVVIDHVSVDGCSDGNIDVTRGSRDVTVQWSVLSNCAKNMLINYEARRVSVHHNVFVNSQWRNPNVSYTDEFTPNVSPDTTADVRNNLVWGWGNSGGGSILQCGAKVNVVRNFYSSPNTTSSRQGNAIVDDGCSVGSRALIHATGNVSNDNLSFDINRVSNQSSAFSAPTVDTSTACVAAHDVLAGAGVSPLDSLDQQTLSAISLPGCAGTPAPVVSLTASPSVITSGASSTLTWSATDASSCTASGAWSGSKATSGSQSVSPSATATYTLTCSGSGGSGSKSVTVSVNPVATPFSQRYEAESSTLVTPMTVGNDSTAFGGKYVSPTSGTESTNPSPEATLTVSVPSAGTYYLWARLFGPDFSSDALYAGIGSSWDRIYPEAIGRWEWVRVETGLNNGAHAFSLAAGSHTLRAGRGEVNARLDAYYLTTDPNEVPPEAPAPTPTPTPTPTPSPAPTVTLSASPSSITSGASSSLTWSSTHATSCTASGGWSGARTTAGSSTVSPTATTGYTLTCSGSGGSASRSVTVTVTAPAPTLSFSASPPSISSGQSSTLTWSSTDATSCTASGAWSGSKATSGSQGVSPASTSTYSLACSGAGGTVSKSATVTVGSSGSSSGYGSDTPGGTGQPVYRVTTLADSGPGSLRDAVSQGNRYVVFDVAGTIELASAIQFDGSFVTVDGSSAPSPGITIRKAGLLLSGSSVHDVVLRHLRIREPGVNYSEGDGITIKNGVHNVLIDHVSVDGCTDGNIDITRNAHDVTVQWSVLSGCGKNMLVNYEANRLSLHHNAFVGSQWRNPNISYTDESSSNVSPDTTGDVRNNLVWGWGDNGGGTILQCGAKANVVNNFYSSPDTSLYRQEMAIVDDGCSVGSSALIYAAGNVSGDPVSIDINRVSNQPAAFPAAFVDTHDACIAAHDVLAGAGAEPLDAVDLQRLGGITLPQCGGSEPGPTEQTLEVRIGSGRDDAHEDSSLRMKVDGANIPVGSSISGFRFSDVTIPQGATILSAKLRLYAAVRPADSISIRYVGEKTGSSVPFGNRRGDLSKRSRTQAAISDSPPAWDPGTYASSPDLSAIVREIVEQSVWASGNALTLFVEDAGSRSDRKAGAYDSSPGYAATLEVRWRP